MRIEQIIVHSPMSHPNVQFCNMESDKVEIEPGESGDANRLTMSEGSDAHVHPLDLFPAEVWLDIFQWLEAPQDLLNLVNTCTTFEDLLEVGSYDTPGAGKLLCQLMEVLPLVMNHLEKADILNLRASCRRMNKSVDKALSETSCYENLHCHPWLLPNFDQRYLREFSFERRNLKLSVDEHPCLILDSVEKIDAVTVELEKGRKPHCRRGPRIVGNRVLIRFFWRPGDPEDDRIVYDVEAEGEFDEEMEMEDEDDVYDDEAEEELEEEVDEYDDGMDSEEDGNLGDDEVGEDNGQIEEDDENFLDEEEEGIDDVEDSDENDDDDFDEESDAEEEDGIPPVLLPYLSDVDPEDRNDFIRSIRSAGPFVLRQREFLEHVLNFLRKLPTEIQGVIFQLGLAHDVNTSTYQMIRNVITSLPNIETLELHNHCDWNHEMPEIPNVVTALKTLITENPLPSAPNLKRIQIHGSHTWPETFLREIGERFGGNLLDLDISISDDDYIDLYDTTDAKDKGPIQIESMEFPALRSLDLSLSSAYLPVLPSFQAPQLRTLRLSGTLTYRRDKTPKVIRLIDILRRYPMLRTYYLELGDFFVDSPDDALEALRNTDFRHANLRTLHITEGSEANMPLSFFTRLCPNLHFMSFGEGATASMMPTKDQDLKLLRSRHMKQSPLWQTSPSLLMIRHTRYGFEPDDEDIHISHIYECTRTRRRP